MLRPYYDSSWRCGAARERFARQWALLCAAFGLSLTVFLAYCTSAAAAELGGLANPVVGEISGYRVTAILSPGVPTGTLYTLRMCPVSDPVNCRGGIAGTHLSTWEDDVWFVTLNEEPDSLEQMFAARDLLKLAYRKLFHESV